MPQVSGNLAGKAFGDDGSFDSDDPTFTGVSGASIEAIVLYVHTGTDSTSRLIMYQDTGVTGRPLTPDGSDVQITVDAGGGIPSPVLWKCRRQLGSLGCKLPS